MGVFFYNGQYAENSFQERYSNLFTIANSNLCSRISEKLQFGIVLTVLSLSRGSFEWRERQSILAVVALLLFLHDHFLNCGSHCYEIVYICRPFLCRLFLPRILPLFSIHRTSYGAVQMKVFDAKENMPLLTWDSESAAISTPVSMH